MKVKCRPQQNVQNVPAKRMLASGQLQCARRPQVALSAAVSALMLSVKKFAAHCQPLSQRLAAIEQSRRGPSTCPPPPEHGELSRPSNTPRAYRPKNNAILISQNRARGTMLRLYDLLARPVRGHGELVRRLEELKLATHTPISTILQVQQLPHPSSPLDACRVRICQSLVMT